MPIFGSRPGSRAASRPGSRPGSAPGSRAPSPTPGSNGRSAKFDSIQIEGNLYDVLKPREAASSGGDSPDAEFAKELQVVLRATASFTLTKPVRASAIRAEFRGCMVVITDPGDGQFREAESETEEILSMSWTIWRGVELEAGREYSFEFNGNLPPSTPRTLRTPSGRIEHTLTVKFVNVTDIGKMRRTRKTIEIWNPFSMDADSPRPGLDFHADLEPEMVGTTVDVDKNLQAFLRFPDQCFKGIGRSFPCEISFPLASANDLSSITHITLDLLQIVWFLRPNAKYPEKPTLLAKDVYPITGTVTVVASTVPQRVSMPLPDPTIHGHYSSDRLRVRHQLQVIFHRKWLGKKFEWEGEVEIFHRDIGWEARGVEGVEEIVRGQEGDYPPLNHSNDVSRTPSLEKDTV